MADSRLRFIIVQYLNFYVCVCIWQVEFNRFYMCVWIRKIGMFYMCVYVFGRLNLTGSICVCGLEKLAGSICVCMYVFGRLFGIDSLYVTLTFCYC